MQSFVKPCLYTISMGKVPVAIEVMLHIRIAMVSVILCAGIFLILALVWHRGENEVQLLVGHRKASNIHTVLATVCLVPNDTLRWPIHSR